MKDILSNDFESGSRFFKSSALKFVDSRQVNPGKGEGMRRPPIHSPIDHTRQLEFRSL